MSIKQFECPYAQKPLTRPCEVNSCNFNLSATPLAKLYRRCFLNYIESSAWNPYQLPQLEGVEFTHLTSEQKREVIVSFFGVADAKDIDRAQTTFYISLFSILMQNIILDLRRAQHDPLPWVQCAVCGTEATEEQPLWVPKRGVLPPGHGYCSWSCYQLKPPPILLVERLLEVDYADLVAHPEFAQYRNRTAFMSRLIRWLFGTIPLD